jgi:hypothetical protein
MTLNKKAVKAFEPQLLDAFAPIMAKLPPEKLSPDKSRAAFYGEGGERDDFVNAVRKGLKKVERDQRSKRRTLLFDLANLHNPEQFPPRFKQLLDWFAFDPAPPEAILRARWTLQYIWNRELSTDAKQHIVQLLLSVAICWPDHGGIYASLLSQHLEFDRRNFLGQLVIGILENWPNMAKCANPECVVPYFFAKRVTQRYCERGECTRYALQKKAREHWRRKYGKSKEGSEE